jgi:hypothetical protein
MINFIISAIEFLCSEQTNGCLISATQLHLVHMYMLWSITTYVQRTFVSALKLRATQPDSILLTL